MALFLAVTAGAATLSDYSDSDKVTAKYATAVDFATQTGILEGMGNGKYAPQGTLTRAQLATMVYRMTTGDVADVYTANFAGGAAENFSDTAATAWYAGYVGYAADAELLKGLGDGTYAPDAALTGYAALAAFLRGVGYDEPGHNFVGADWTIEVAKVAKQAGALEGITNVDLNKPITREVAAQIIYNIMFAKNVVWTDAFGYQTSNLMNKDYGTLALDEFKIVSEKDGDAANVAPWGRPATIWVAKDGSDVTAAVTIEATPVATYTTAVNQCDLSKELGETGTWTATKWENGGKGTTSISATATKSDVAGTAQGVLTEVYEVEKDVYEIVEVQTWLAEVDDVVKTTFDKNGHETRAAKTTLKAYNNENVAPEATVNFYAETETFAEDSYVLMNNSWFSASNGKVTVGNVVYTPELDEGVDYGVLNLTAATPVATGEMTAYSNTAKTSTIGGTTYNWAQKFGMGFKGSVDTIYDVYVDFYGNVIGIEEPATVYSFGIITKMAWNPSQTALEDAEAFATIVDFTAASHSPEWMHGVADDVVMERPQIYALAIETAHDDFTGVAVHMQGDFNYREVSETAANDDEYYDVAFEFETLSDGSKLITDMGDSDTVTIEKGKTTMVGDIYATNDFTVYLVKTDDDTYVSYTGFKNVPSMKQVPVTYFTDGDYVSYMFVDATNAVFTGSSFYAYIADEEFDGKDGNLYAYEMYVNGAKVTKRSEYADLGVGFAGTGLYEVTVDADENILSVSDLDAAHYIMTISGVTSCTGTVITNDPTAISHENAPIYVIDSAAKTVDTNCTYADAVENTCFVILDEANGDVAVAIYIYK